MKKALLLFILYACYSAAYAQTSDLKSKPAVNRNMGLEIAAGYSIALGTYASSDTKNKESGYATNGWQMQVTFDWMGKKNFGLALQYTFQRNSMENATTLVFPNGMPPSEGSGTWSNHYLLAGPVFMTTVGRLHIDAKVLGGALVSSSVNFNTPNPSDTTGFSSNENIATGFGYQLSAGVGYAVSSHFAIKFNLNLMGGWPGASKSYGSQLIGYEQYKDPVTGIKYLTPVYSAPVAYDIKKVVTTLNPSLGLVYRF